MAMPDILLFDIDGTLLRINRRFMHSLLEDVMDSLNLELSVLGETPFAGRTDRSIFKALAGHGSGEPQFLNLKSRYIAAMKNRLKKQDITVFDHVHATLEYCRSQNYKMGLLTGNFREIAAIKLELVGLSSYFTFGAFGCDHIDRNKLGPEAQANYLRRHRQTAEPGRFVIIGDTPLDIACAKEFGCSSVAVTTGNYGKDELSGLKPDVILEDLRNPDHWLNGLSGVERG